MSNREQTAERKRERIDRELALTADLLNIANQLTRYAGWRTALRSLYYVVMRISLDRGRKNLIDFLSENGW